jgi:oligopeptidase B
MNPPIAKAIPQKLEKHGHVRIDNYYWLRDRENPDVIDYLKAENAYKDEKLAHTKELQETLFEEMKGRIKKDDSSVPYQVDDYFYYTRYEKGKEYPIHCRKKDSLENAEEILIDVNIIAEGKDYCSVSGGANVSPDHRYLLYGTDFVSRRIYTLYIKDLTTGELLSDIIPDVTGNAVWAADNRTIFYSKQDPETLRSFQIYRHVIGNDIADDELIFEEKDDTFRTYVYKTKSKKFIAIFCSSTLTNEAQILEADNPNGEFRMFLPREREHEYSIDHAGDHFYIHTNWEAKNFRLMRCGEQETDKSNWEEVIPHREDVLLEDIELFQNYLVLDERKGGLNHIRIIPNEGEEHYLPFDEAAYMAGTANNPNYASEWLRFTYQSMTTPGSVFDYNMRTGEKILRKEQEVLGDFDKTNYRTERLFAPAKDGIQVPISIAYHKDTAIDGKAPLLLYGYGSYGHSMDAYFSTTRLSLLDRGFVFAIAHIRGGEEMGRAWYDDGRMLNKINTFTDFIACGEHLVAKKYCAPDKLYAMGGSAGGLLMGAIMNLKPEIWAGIVAAVPFVDVVTTMLDDTIPLTTGEYDEWGNPNDKTYYDYILSYSPYDQVEAKAYPPTLVTTGLHDSQVQYWEPAKWVARLREMKTDDNVLMLHTNMEAGHGGKSGRFEALREVAMEYAFLLTL